MCPIATDFNDLEALSMLVNYRRWIVSAFAPHLGNRCIEYGAGIGNISDMLRPYVEELHLIEPFKPSFLTLSEKYRRDAGVHLSCETVEDSVVDIQKGSFDSVVMVNVLEHIENDVALLSRIFEILRPTGTLCIFVPAHYFLFSAYDRLVGHYRRYELPDLSSKLVRAGFEVTRATYFDMIGVVPWFISMKLLHQTRIRSTLASLYDTLVVPLGRRLEANFNPPFGKNILLIGRKP